jgi:hypothetical protein
LVEHATENCGVVSSILTLGTPDLLQVGPAGVVQLVERLLAKEKVVGSSPIARSQLRLLIVDFIGKGTDQNHQSAIFKISAHGVVAKWQGKGLQNPDHGSKSRRRLSELLERAAFIFLKLLGVRQVY